MIGEAADAVIRQASPGQLIRVVETPDDLILISDIENKGVLREQQHHTYINPGAPFTY